MKKVLAMGSLAVLLGVTDSVDAMRERRDAVFNASTTNAQGQPRVQPTQQDPNNQQPTQQDSNNQQQRRHHHSTSDDRSHPVNSRGGKNRRGGGSRRPVRSKNDQVPQFSLSQNNTRAPQAIDQNGPQRFQGSRQAPMPASSNRPLDSQNPSARMTIRDDDENLPVRRSQRPAAQSRSLNLNNDYSEGSYAYSDQEERPAVPTSKDISYSKELIRDLVRQKRTLEFAVQKVESSSEKARQQLETADHLLDTLGQNQGKLSQSIDTFSRMIDDVQSLIADLTGEADSLSKSIEDLRCNEKTVQDWITSLTNANNSATRESAKLENEIKELQVLLGGFQRGQTQDSLLERVQSVINGSEDLNAAIDSKESEINDLLQCFNETMDKISDLQDKASDVKQSIDKLQEAFAPREEENKEANNKNGINNSQQIGNPGDNEGEEDEFSLSNQPEEDQNENEVQIDQGGVLDNEEEEQSEDLSGKTKTNPASHNEDSEGEEA